MYILKVPSITLGIGLYLPLGLTIAVFIGGMIRFVVDKLWKKQSENGTVIASRNIRRRKFCRSDNSINFINVGIKSKVWKIMYSVRNGRYFKRK